MAKANRQWVLVFKADFYLNHSEAITVSAKVKNPLQKAVSLAKGLHNGIPIKITLKEIYLGNGDLSAVVEEGINIKIKKRSFIAWGEKMKLEKLRSFLASEFGYFPFRKDLI